MVYQIHCFLMGFYWHPSSDFYGESLAEESINSGINKTMNFKNVRTKFAGYNFLELVYNYLMNLKKKLHLFKCRIMAKILRKDIVHFLHIGKTGGSSIKFALKNREKPYINNKYIIISHPHSFKLKDTKPGEKYFFFIRDPIDRFISGFYSRKRKGMPRIYNEWSPYEKEAFETFNTPNELAISLSSKNKNIKKKAVKAMKSIGHVRYSYWYWFEDTKYFLSRIQDIVFVGTQKNFDKDFLRLKKILNLPKKLELPIDRVSMHKNPKAIDKHLDIKAIKNLKKWYSKDYQFLELLKNRKLI